MSQSGSRTSSVPRFDRDEPPSERVLNFDPSDLAVHGRQDCRFFHGFYGRDCLLPLTL